MTTKFHREKILKVFLHIWLKVVFHTNNNPTAHKHTLGTSALETYSPFQYFACKDEIEYYSQKFTFQFKRTMGSSQALKRAGAVMDIIYTKGIRK
jgi:hypothetical protein